MRVVCIVRLSHVLCKQYTVRNLRITVFNNGTRLLSCAGQSFEPRSTAAHRLSYYSSISMYERCVSVSAASVLYIRVYVNYDEIYDRMRNRTADLNVFISRVKH